MNTPSRPPHWSLCLLTVLLGSWTAGAAPEPGEEFHETYPLSKNGRVQLENLNGDVRVVTWDREEIKVDARKHAKRPELLEQAQIEVEATADRVRIRTKYPDGKTEQKRDSQATVNYTLTVPRQCRLDSIQTVNGSVRIEAVGGGVKARSVNGKVEATQLTEATDLSTVNGAVNATFASVKAGVSLSSVNGAVTIALPADADATVTAKTVTGAIHTDFPLELKGHSPVGQNLHGTLGQGSAKIKMSSVNGPIRVVRE